MSRSTFLRSLLRACWIGGAALGALACSGSSTDTGGGTGTGTGSGTGTGGGAGSGAAPSSSGSASASAPSSSSGATCASTFGTLCDRAFVCGKDACRFAIETDAGTTAGSATWKTVDECKSFWLYTCQTPGGVRANFDYDACTDALAASGCVTTPEGDALAYPAVCNVNAN